MRREINMPVVKTTRKGNLIENLKEDIHRLQAERDTYKNQKESLLIMMQNLHADFKKSGIAQTEYNKLFISKLSAINNACENLKKNPMMKF